MAQKNIVVIGAGVAGLTTAFLLSKESRYKIVVVAKHMPGDYDIEYASCWAGANYMPVSKAGTAAAKWDRDTWAPLADLAQNHPEAGIHFQECYIYNRTKDVGSATATWFAELLSPNPWFKEILPNFRSIPKGELAPGIDSATAFTSVCINTAIYLPWLVSQCLKNGVTFQRGVFKHVLDAAAPTSLMPKVDLVINCTGLGAASLGGVEDKTVVPARGQIVVVRNTAGSMVDVSGTDDGDDEACYVMTRAAGGGTVLGGSYQKGKWESQPDPNLAIRIMKRAVQACPQLTGGKDIEHLDIIRHGVGLRPVREAGTRIEKERLGKVEIVHNYGAGGAGYQSSYGCALAAVQLVREGLADHAYILSCCLVSFLLISFYGNVRLVDAFFFGVSSSTGSGLNPIDVKALRGYQQLVTYLFGILTNIGFINVVVVIIRLRWFEKRFRHAGTFSPGQDPQWVDSRPYHLSYGTLRNERHGYSEPVDLEQQVSLYAPPDEAASLAREEADDPEHTPTHISFAPDPRENQKQSETALYIPSPLAREQGHPFVEVEARSDKDSDASVNEEGDYYYGRPKPGQPFAFDRSILPGIGRSLSRATTVERAVASLFVQGGTHGGRINRPGRLAGGMRSEAILARLPGHAAIRRNSFFSTMSFDDTQLRGEIEYRALRLLLKIVVAYFFGLHLFGAICLMGWVWTSEEPKYRDYIDSQGLSHTWWALYSAGTMVNNVGLTLTPDSMAMFKDATFPMLVMSFLAFAGNTCYPILLRLTIWTMARIGPRARSRSSDEVQEALQFLLDHPRRCYTLLFPSRQTWVLLGNLIFLNLVDVLLIILLDLHNPAVNDLPLGGPRILASLFQAACSRHTGAAVFDLAKLNPAVQFSILVSIYIAVFPIAICIRISNTYDDHGPRSLGAYDDGDDNNHNNDTPEPNCSSSSSSSYVLSALRNQLSFDLWYISLGIFLICIAEADQIMDTSELAIAVFPIFFEVVSAYGNVGLSLGHPAVMTSLCGRFSAFSKLVLCAMMIRAAD
ncbi:hypothetical protein DV735_g2867, partial [Chaetothyriales sp. CBS 134920]